MEIQTETVAYLKTRWKLLKVVKTAPKTRRRKWTLSWVQFPISQTQVCLLKEPKSDPERIRSFKDCQPKDFQSTTIWFHLNIQSCNSEKMSNRWATSANTVISTLKVL
jgi:hypothetical protein